MKKITWKIVKWGVLVYVLTFLAEWLLDIPVFSTYKDFLLVIKTWIQDWWDWALIAGVSIYACRNIVEIKYDTQERIREDRLTHEIKRYQNTPYISPLFFYYLTNPPQGYSRNQFKEINNRFYQRVINAFRDRVYINAHYTEENPLNRPSLLELIGVKDFLRTLVIFSLTLGWFAGMVFTGNLASEWQRFLIPALIYLSLYVAMKIQAYVEMNYTILDRVLYSYYGEPEPRIRWIELMPNQARGDIILKVWEAERERRQRYTYLIQNRPVPDVISQYTNPSIAVFPYPSVSLPDWIEQAEIFFEERQNEWSDTSKANSHASNVVPFNKKFRKLL